MEGIIKSKKQGSSEAKETKFDKTSNWVYAHTVK